MGRLAGNRQGSPFSPVHCSFSACAVALVLAGPVNARPAMTHGVAHADLARAARNAPVKAIDYDQARCDGRTVEQWLVALAGANARAITWTGGPCQLVGPGIDGGSHWCGQGVVTLKLPKSRDDRPLIEVFFEAPRRGRPGRPYAFRGAMLSADGLDNDRFRNDFEADWTSRFPAPPGAIVDCAQQASSGG